jgi:hypothetical protein
MLVCMMYVTTPLCDTLPPLELLLAGGSAPHTEEGPDLSGQNPYEYSRQCPVGLNLAGIGFI